MRFSTPSIPDSLQSTNCLEAFRQAKKVVEGLVNGTVRFVMKFNSGAFELMSFDRLSLKTRLWMLRRALPCMDQPVKSRTRAMRYVSSCFYMFRYVPVHMIQLTTICPQAFKSFTNQALLGLSKDHHREFLAKCQGVTKDEVISVIRKYCLPLFSPASSVAVVASPPGKVEATIKGLRELGYDVEQRETDEFKLADNK